VTSKIDVLSCLSVCTWLRSGSTAAGTKTNHVPEQAVCFFRWWECEVACGDPAAEQGSRPADPPATMHAFLGETSWASTPAIHATAPATLARRMQDLETI
jgi:hypothetical protein